MGLFSPEEKQMVQEALSVYLQYIQQRISKENAAGYLEIAQNLLEKIDLADGASSTTPSEKPKGISDELFEACCKSCDKLAPGGRCTDKITEKYPGKCDPILLYQRGKSITNG